MTSAPNPLFALPLSWAGPPVRSEGVATVLLHGRARSPAEMLWLAAQLELDSMPFVAVEASGGTWYPESFLAPLDRNKPHLEWALERLENVVRTLEMEGVSREHIAFVGFSQGACLACEYLFRTPRRWGALAALTGGLIGPPEATWESLPEASFRGTPTLLATSDVDAWVPLERVRTTARVFQAMGAEVDLRVVGGREHVVSEEELVATREILAALLERRKRP